MLDPLVGSIRARRLGLMIATYCKDVRPELDLYLNTDRAVETLAGEKAAACGSADFLCGGGAARAALGDPRGDTGAL